jgi:hypothetical protein
VLKLATKRVPSKAGMVVASPGEQHRLIGLHVEATMLPEWSRTMAPQNPILVSIRNDAYVLTFSYPNIFVLWLLLRS